MTLDESKQSLAQRWNEPRIFEPEPSLSFQSLTKLSTLSLGHLMTFMTSYYSSNFRIKDLLTVHWPLRLFGPWLKSSPKALKKHAKAGPGFCFIIYKPDFWTQATEPEPPSLRASEPEPRLVPPLVWPEMGFVEVGCKRTLNGLGWNLLTLRSSSFFAQLLWSLHFCVFVSQSLLSLFKQHRTNSRKAGSPEKSCWRHSTSRSIYPSH